MTGVVTVLRPYATNAQRELVAMPKVYGFDTGFVCHSRGWQSQRREDGGNMWEHLVLDELKFELPDATIHYWWKKQKRKVDFVIDRKGLPPITIECKWRASGADYDALAAFRSLHPYAVCWLIAADQNTCDRTQHANRGSRLVRHC